jgi:hypothetical protein
LLGKAEGRGAEKDIDKMNLKEIEYKCTDWIYLVRNKDTWQNLVNIIINFRVP